MTDNNRNLPDECNEIEKKNDSMDALSSENAELSAAIETEPEKDILGKVGKKILSIVKAVLYTLLFFGMQVVVSVIATVFIMIIKGGDSAAALDIYAKWSNLLIFVSGLISLVVVGCIYVIKNTAARRENREKFTDFIALRPAKIWVIVLAFVTGIFLNYALNIIFAFLPESWLDSYSDAASALDSGPLLFYILGGVIMAPIAEEIFFRGLVLERLDREFPTWIAVVASSLIFGIGHGQILWIVYATALGIVFGYIYKRTGSLFTSIAMHFGFNGINIISYAMMESDIMPILEKSKDLTEFITLASESLGNTDMVLGVMYYIFHIFMTAISFPVAITGLVLIFVLGGIKKKKADLKADL